MLTYTNALALELTQYCMLVDDRLRCLQRVDCAEGDTLDDRLRGQDCRYFEADQDADAMLHYQSAEEDSEPPCDVEGPQLQCSYTITEVHADHYRVDIVVTSEESINGWRMRHRLPNCATLKAADPMLHAARLGGDLVDVSSSAVGLTPSYYFIVSREEGKWPTIPEEAKLWSGGRVHKILFAKIQIVGSSVPRQPSPVASPRRGPGGFASRVQSAQSRVHKRAEKKHVVPKA